MQHQGLQSVTPLIEAAEAYPAIEEAIIEAREEIFLAYWTFAPTMHLTSAKAPADVSDWQSLIGRKVREGVRVRMLISDFDPVFTGAFHADATRAYLKLMALRGQLPEKVRPNFQIVLSRNYARPGRLFEILMQPLRQSMLASQCREARKLRRDQGGRKLAEWLQMRPGIWPETKMRADGPHMGRFLAYGPTYPAVHHEKTCLIDGKIAFLGGLDIHPKRFDDARHTAEDAWHDLSIRIEGGAIPALASRLARRWNNERREFEERSDGQIAPSTSALPTPLQPIRLCPTDPIESPWMGCDLAEAQTACSPHSAPKAAGKIPRAKDIVRVCSTDAAQRRTWLRRVPPPGASSIRDCFLQLIEEAETLLYIETQYFRDPVIGRALARRAKYAPNLRVILVLPLVPDLMADTRDANMASRHGNWLQWRNVTRVRRAFGHRAEAYTLIRNGPAKPEAQPQVVAHGSDMVYCHAKLMMVDDRACILGSANLNGRSLRLDTEACVEWRDASAIEPFRKRLWQQHFGAQESHSRGAHAPLIEASLAEAPGVWHHLAVCNTLHPPGERAGFIVPFPEEHLQYAARWSPLVPSAGV